MSSRYLGDQELTVFEKQLSEESFVLLEEAVKDGVLERSQKIWNFELVEQMLK